MKHSIILRIIALTLVSLMLFGAVGCNLESIFGEIDTGNGVIDGSEVATSKATQKESEKASEKATEAETAEDTKEADENAEEPTFKVTETEGETAPNTPNNPFYGELDFEGEEIAIIFPDHEPLSREWRKEIAEDNIDEAIEMRTQVAMENLNIMPCYEIIPWGSYSDCASRFSAMIQVDVLNDLHYYDVASGYGYSTSFAGIRDFTTNLLDEVTFPYFDFTLPCWNQSLVENTTINGNLFYLVGDVNTSMFDAAYMVWYNNNLYNEHMEGSDPEDLQDLALSSEWTYEVLYNWATRLYASNGGPDYNTYALMAGTTSAANNVSIAFQYAFDATFIVETGNTTHSFDISSNRRISDAFSKTADLYKQVGVAPTANVNRFAEGRILFYIDEMRASREANDIIRSMEDSYAILPMPKLNADQMEYGTITNYYATRMFVINHSESSINIKGEAISAYLQFLSELSYTTVRPIYFDNVIVPKFGWRDEDRITKSKAIFNVIVSNVNYDLTYIYSPQINDISWLWRDALRNEIDLVSYFNQNKAQFESALKGLDGWFKTATN